VTAARRDDRLRVLMMTDSLNAGGAERVAVDVANTLDRSTHEVWFCATRVGGPLVDRVAPDVEVTVLGRRATWDLTKLLTLARLVRSNRIDVVHTHGRGTMKFVALARALKLIDAKHVFHDHFGWLHLDRGASRGLRRAMITQVDVYLGVDSRLCTWARDTVGMPADRVHLIRSGVDHQRFQGVTPVDLRAELGLGADDVVAVMAANFRPQKDHPTLLRAMALLPDDLRARFHLVIVGSTTADDDYFAGCAEMIDRLGLADSVHLHGPSDDVPGMLAGADFAVLSSKNETGPLVVLEYMAAGVPFVATDTGEITRSVRDLDVGLIPAPRDHREMADALRTMLEMAPDQRRAMGERGRVASATRYDQPIVTRVIEERYRDVVGTARGGSRAE